MIPSARKFFPSPVSQARTQVSDARGDRGLRYQATPKMTRAKLAAGSGPAAGQRKGQRTGLTIRFLCYRLPVEAMMTCGVRQQAGGGGFSDGIRVGVKTFAVAALGACPPWRERRTQSKHKTGGLAKASASTRPPLQNPLSRSLLRPPDAGRGAWKPIPAAGPWRHPAGRNCPARADRPWSEIKAKVKGKKDVFLTNEANKCFRINKSC